MKTCCPTGKAFSAALCHLNVKKPPIFRKTATTAASTLGHPLFQYFSSAGAFLGTYSSYFPVFVTTKRKRIGNEIQSNFKTS